jgi:hypothetical protein
MNSIKFRFHRGSLDDSLATERIVESRKDVAKIITEQAFPYLPVDQSDLVIQYYTYDPRINEDLWIVLIAKDGVESVIGFLNHEL